ncbi:hypothetical protein OH76DRAFT_354933 [Lentinus brumalis]|nr:hypothetical protein OH76DRAFT_354933 [Polyporus brumalis]
MVSVRRLLVSVLPILTAPARAIQLIPSFLAAEDDYLASSNSSFLHNVAVAAEVLEREGCIRTSLEVRPEQGGQRITRVWLESLSQRECLWRFRYVLCYE